MRPPGRRGRGHVALEAEREPEIREKHIEAGEVQRIEVDGVEVAYHLVSITRSNLVANIQKEGLVERDTYYGPTSLLCEPWGTHRSEPSITVGTSLSASLL